jgi:hypothetical protein
MKYKLNLTKEQIINYVYFSLGLLVLLQIIFYKSGLFRVLVISLKLSLFIHLPGYLVALKTFKEEFDTIGLLFIGFAFGLILTAFFYYVPSLFGININQITYIMPIVLIIVGLLINLGNVKKELNE